MNGNFLSYVFGDVLNVNTHNQATGYWPQATEAPGRSQYLTLVTTLQLRD
jgi:hypothetical protein